MICRYENCKKEFKANRTNQIYCSSRCAHGVASQRRRYRFKVEEKLKLFSCLGHLCRGQRCFMTTKQVRICPRCKSTQPRVNPLLEKYIHE